MTRDEIMAMDDDALRIAVARALGWAWYKNPIDENSTYLFDKDDRRCGYWKKVDAPNVGDELYTKCPDYPRDIRAAYELEDALPDKQREEYSWQLFRIVDMQERDTFEVGRWQLIHASAADRCRAWLWTMEG